MTVEIVILAMIAALLGLRLYSVLGRRAEHGEEPLQSRQAGQQAQPATAPARLPERALPQQSAPRAREIPAVVPAVEKALREIMGADRRFDPNAFVDGARQAYRMILDAFWRGDKDELAHLCDPVVAGRFGEAIDARKTAGEVPDNRVVRINEAAIVGAALAGTTARVAIRFVTDIAAVTRDGEGRVIAGSLDDAVEVRDVWTFCRDIRATDPDWLLDETDEG
ncbi:MAG TPA: Tim44/TimA family putative adaptor protein [Novosphingobium sp.]|nr:Tim44/TimA family putative adaptor protein [Novosphingobium sp.]